MPLDGSDDTTTAQAGGYNGLLGTPPQPSTDPLTALLGGTVDPATLQTLQRQNAMNSIIAQLGAMGAASGPSHLPVPFGVVAGKGALAGQEAQRENLNNTLLGLQIAPRIEMGRLQAATLAQNYNLVDAAMRKLGLGGLPRALTGSSTSPPSYAPTAPATTANGITNPYEAATRVAESSNNPNARNLNPDGTINTKGTSSGLYGFTDGALQDVLKNHPELKDVPDPKNDPRVLAAFRQDNAQKFFNNNGRFPTPDEERAMHVNGANGAAGFAGSSQPTRVASNGTVPLGTQPTSAGTQPQGTFLGMPADLAANGIIASRLGLDKLFEKITPGWENIRANSYVRDPYGNVQQFPAAPQNMQIIQRPDGSFAAVDVPNARAGMAANEQTTQDILQQKEQALARQRYELQTGLPAPSPQASTAPAPNLPPGISAGGAVLPSGRTIGQAQMAAIPPATTVPPAVDEEGNIITSRGTVVPNAQQYQTLAEGEKPAGAQLDRSSKVIENWNNNRANLETQRSRLGVLSQSFQTLEGRGLNESKADLSNVLRGAGLPWVADKIMSAKDTASVQQALWAGMQDVMSNLKTLVSGSGGRILNSEFQAFMEHGFSPDMLGPALYKAVTEQLGTMHQQTNLINDWYTQGKMRGWKDQGAENFQSNWLAKNPIEGFTNYARITTPPFKGMEGNPGAGQQQPPYPGAKLAPDGKWYVQQNGQWHLVNP
jgi:hypothetical protein